MLYLILFSILSIASGAFALSFLDPNKKFGFFSRLVFSLVLGFILQGFVTLVLALITKNLEIAAWITLGISAIISAIFFKKTLSYLLPNTQSLFPAQGTRHKTLGIKKIVTYCCLLVITAVVLLLAYQSMIWMDGFPYGILKGWGDGAYHMDMIQVLAQSQPFALNHPIAGGTPLTYTFFINFVSALFLKMGSSFALAWHLPLFVFAAGIVAGLCNIGKLLLKRTSLQIAFIAIVLFGGGLGIFLAPQNDQGLASIITDPQYEYTHMDVRTGGKPSEAEIDKNIVWITPAISFFSHQRSFMPAAALAFLFLAGILTYWKTDKIWLWFVLIGFIPLSHLHTTVAMGIFAIVIFLFNFSPSLRAQRSNPVDRLPRSRWSLAMTKTVFLPIAIGIIIALPQLLFLLSNSVFSSPTPPADGSSSPLALWFGWMTCAHNTNWLACDPNTAGTDTNVIWFWLKNFGIVFAAWAASLLFIKKIKASSPLLAIFISGSIIFIMGNILKFQPWEFDNNKLLFYWWFVAALVFVYLLERSIGNRSSASPNRSQASATDFILRGIAYGLSIILILTSLASGAVDVLTRTKLGINPNMNETHFGYYGNDVHGIVSFIKQQTPSNAVIISSSYANQFIPMTTGRALYLGFEGWLWTQGRAQTGSLRRSVIHQFLQTGNPSEVCADGATHIFVDTTFHQEYAGFITENISLTQTKKVFEDGVKALYELNCEFTETVG